MTDTADPPFTVHPVPDGPCLLAMHLEGEPDEDLVAAVTAAGNRIRESFDRDDLLVVALAPGQSIEMLGDDDLAALGLVRIDRIRHAARRDTMRGAHHDILTDTADALDGRVEQPGIGAASLRRWLADNTEGDTPGP